jgi:Na+/H+ antiporter NhaD/arsenite permease-like protein
LPAFPTEPASLIAAVVFAATYLVLAVGRVPPLRIDRTGAAIIGAIVMVEAAGLDLETAYHALDYRTLILLFGMMVLIAHLRLARFFRTVARVIVVRVHHPQLLLVAVVFVTGALSALFVNDTICLVFTPVLVEIATARGHRPLPYLLALATASNIGSVATITGNPQNMLIGSVSRIEYSTFLLALGPVALAGLAIDAALLCWVFRRELVAGPLEHAGRRPRPAHRAMMAKGLLVAAGVLAGFLAGVEPALVAAAAAAALLVTRRVNPAKIYRQIDWDLLMLFVGLFVVVAGVEHARLDEWFFALLRPVGIDTVWGLSTVAAVLSNVISNVPAVMLFTKLVPQLPHPETAWLTLAMASTLAGNLTLLGSIANLIVLEGARRHGHRIGFLEYFRIGLPVTLLTIGFGVWWLS